jgi:hypothetical protein
LNIDFSFHAILFHNIFFSHLPEKKCSLQKIERIKPGCSQQHFPEWTETFSRTAEKYVNNKNAELLVILKALVSLQTYNVIKKVLSL